MDIKYKIDGITHSVIIRKDPVNEINNDLNLLKTDKKILFIYDSKIDKKIITKYLINLKISGNKIYKKIVIGGKENKNEKFLFNIIKQMSDLKFTKKSIVISCGGGVIGDVSALAACLYMRGLIYFHIPTTITAIFDSCIGGKTGINYLNKINLVGTYYHPLRVYISEEIVKTIPEREYFSGFAEAIKCGIIGNKKILNILENKREKLVKKDFTSFKNLCSKILQTKINFFLHDIKEKNKRLILNFGHTFAHSFEMVTASEKNLPDISHGEAVSIGILCEMYYSKTNLKFQKRIKSLLKNYLLPINFFIPAKVDKIKIQKQILQNLFLDKKRLGKFPRYININKKIVPSVEELDNLSLINETILKFVK